MIKFDFQCNNISLHSNINLDQGGGATPWEINAHFCCCCCCLHVMLCAIHVNICISISWSQYSYNLKLFFCLVPQDGKVIVWDAFTTNKVTAFAQLGFRETIILSAEVRILASATCSPGKSGLYIQGD